MKTINEYLLSKKNKKVAVKPKFRCSIDELKDWLISLGVEENEFIMYAFATKKDGTVVSVDKPVSDWSGCTITPF